MKLDRKITGFSGDYELNPVQEEVEKYIHEHVNLLITSNTGTGKTNCFCMKAYRHLFEIDKKSIVVYIAPTKALVEEKKQEFEDPNHPYYKFQVVTITSDYVSKDTNEAKNADIVLMTPESFSHRVRNYTSDKHNWITDIGLLCFDEFHIIDDITRGSHIEASLINFCRINEDAEILALSATIPNGDELTEWLDLLNKYDTVRIHSDYRPTKLHEKIVKIPLSKDMYKEKIKNIESIIKDRKKDQGLIGVFNKSFGQKIIDALDGKSHTSDFHHGGLDKKERAKVENNFKNKSTQFIVCTSTLFAGVNLPADYVISTAVKAGGGDIKVYELKQMAGRAGRPQYGKDGTVYYFIEDNEDFSYHVTRIKNGELIQSQMGIVANVALHLLGCVNLGIITNKNSFCNWYRETLYYYQKGEGNIDVEKLCNRVEEALIKRGMLKNLNGTYKLTRRGLICTQMSIEPILASELIRNFDKFFKISSTYNNLEIAKAFGACLPNKQYPAKEVAKVLPAEIKKITSQEYYIPVAAYYYLLNGEKAPKEIYSSIYNYRNDFSRLCQTLNRFGQESENWGEFSKKMFNTLPSMVYNKVEYNTAYLISQGCSPFQAKRLARQGITDLKDVK